MLTRLRRNDSIVIGCLNDAEFWIVAQMGVLQSAFSSIHESPRVA